jgi:hypothetical protein
LNSAFILALIGFIRLSLNGGHVQISTKKNRRNGCG